jgi:Icc protein
MIVAQITDTHIQRKGRRLFGTVNAASHLRRCVARLNALEPRPDIVIATGDLADGGRPKEYRRLRDMLDELRMPVYLIPGNHDDGEALRAAFPHHDYLPRLDPSIQYVLDEYPVRLIGLDSTEPGRAGGLLDASRLRWLEARLRERPDVPTLVFVHHPPFRTGIPQMDALGFEGADAFGAIVARNPQIERVVSGHIHRAMQVRWNGTIACTAPSTAYQLVLALREEHPLGLSLEPPGFALHIWDRGGMLTHIAQVERYEGLVPLHHADRSR